MMQPADYDRDPIRWTWAITALFAALCAVRLTTPSSFYFDEVHYLPAARAILGLTHPANPEHPPLGKELIAAGIALFGDRALGWRAMPWLFGAIALFAAMRAMWFASERRMASLATGVLIATGFPLFIHARIAMLDVFMVSFLLVALWQFAAALRENETARWRFAIAGVALGCAMASKWNAIPLAVLPGLAFLAIRARASGWRLLWTSRAEPVRGMSLVEAALWLGLVPLVTYAAAYWPNLFYADGAIEPTGIVALHQHMLELQHKLLKPHNYQSHWWQWVSNTRGIWYLYEPVDGAQRGVVLIGNPLTFWLGLPALLWCLWVGLAKRRWDALAVAGLYAISLGLWIVAAKNVQFFYHYMLASCFLLAALALVVDDLWRRGGRTAWLALAVLAASTALFIHFWPIISSAALPGGRNSYVYWMWLHGWR
jgi:dolichyl-phosphate-mannose--protein O-mannosyl transferase